MRQSMTGSYSRHHTLAGHRARAKHTLLNPQSVHQRVFIPFVNELILYIFTYVSPVMEAPQKFPIFIQLFVFILFK